jgi:hypothetical protein
MVVHHNRPKNQKGEATATKVRKLLYTTVMTCSYHDFRSLNLKIVGLEGSDTTIIT